MQKSLISWIKINISISQQRKTNEKLTKSAKKKLFELKKADNQHNTYVVTAENKWKKKPWIYRTPDKHFFI